MGWSEREFVEESGMVKWRVETLAQGVHSHVTSLADKSGRGFEMGPVNTGFSFSFQKLVCEISFLRGTTLQQAKCYLVKITTAPSRI